MIPELVLLPVGIGGDFGTQIEITSGLTPDASVIDSPPDSLVDGEGVTVAAKTPPSTVAAKTPPSTVAAKTPPSTEAAKTPPSEGAAPKTQPAP